MAIHRKLIVIMGALFCFNLCTAPKMFALLYVQDVHGNRQNVELEIGSHKNGARENFVVKGELRFPNNVKIELNAMPYEKFRALLGNNQLFIQNDEFPASEEADLKLFNSPADALTTKTVFENLYRIQRRLNDLNSKTGPLAAQEYRKIFNELSNYIYPDYHMVGTQEEKSYLRGKALSLQVIALLQDKNFPQATYFLNSERSIAYRMRDYIADVTPWFNTVREAFTIKKVSIDSCSMIC